MNNKLILVLILTTIVLISSCAGTFDAAEIAKANNVVKQFLLDYPQAELTASLVKNISIQEACKNEQLEIKDYWKVEIFDPNAKVTVKAYIDPSTKEAVCITKSGSLAKSESNNTIESKTGTDNITEPETKEINNLQIAENINQEDGKITKPTCIPNWQCTLSECNFENTQLRTCIDNNNCGTLEDKPKETQTCTPKPKIYKIGEAASNGKISLKINSITYIGDRIYRGYQPPCKNCWVLIANVTVKNIDSPPGPYADPSHFYFKMDSDKENEYNSMYKNGDQNIVAWVYKGGEVSTRILIALPINKKATAIVFSYYNDKFIFEPEPSDIQLPDLVALNVYWDLPWSSGEIPNSITISRLKSFGKSAKGGEVHVIGSIQNKGNAESGGSIKILIDGKEYGNFGSNLLEKGIINVSYYLERFTLPSELWEPLVGVHTVELIVDQNSGILESNEDNNRLIRTVNVVDNSLSPEITEISDNFDDGLGYSFKKYDITHFPIPEISHVPLLVGTNLSWNIRAIDPDGNSNELLYRVYVEYENKAIEICPWTNNNTCTWRINEDLINKKVSVFFAVRDKDNFYYTGDSNLGDDYTLIKYVS